MTCEIFDELKLSNFSNEPTCVHENECPIAKIAGTKNEPVIILMCKALKEEGVHADMDPEDYAQEKILADLEAKNATPKS